MALGLLWALGVVWGTQTLDLPFIPAPIAVPGAMLGPGLALLLMIGRLAQRRFFDDTITDGQDFLPHTPAWLDQRVLSNTVEQSVLALLIWPFVTVTLGGAVVLVMGAAFFIARLAFWLGYHLSPPLRAFGFAATFYTTVLAALWSGVVWAY
ncbi:MAPEG family protein [Arenibacterium sp. CAU 1754]